MSTVRSDFIVNIYTYMCIKCATLVYTLYMILTCTISVQLRIKPMFQVSIFYCQGQGRAHQILTTTTSVRGPHTRVALAHCSCGQNSTDQTKPEQRTESELKIVVRSFRWPVDQSPAGPGQHLPAQPVDQLP